MKLYSIITFLLLFTQASFATENLECIKSGTFKYIYRSQSYSLKSNYCFNKERNILFSENCSKNKNCEAKKVAAKFRAPSSLSLFNGGVGSPGFQICYAMDGVPQIVEFFDGKEWFKLDRCQFSKDSSYIDTGSLLKMWSEKQS